jgi:hypothetical protein
VNGRIFATIHPNNKEGGLMLTPEQQAEFMSGHAEMFVPAAGKWGLQGSTMVQFSRADPEVVGQAVTQAWRNAMAKPPARKRAVKTRRSR